MSTMSVTTGLPANVEAVIGGRDRELNRKLGIFVPEFPVLDPASNFTRFTPPSATDVPETLFTAGIPDNASIPSPRLLRISNPREFLVYVDGSCIGNGTPDATAGSAFVFRPETSISRITSEHLSRDIIRPMKLHTLGYCNFRVEARGPNGEVAEPTSNRAELRATIAALQFRHWTGEGLQRLVIATDSSYVVEGCTQWVKKWPQTRWATRTGAPVKNRDLWEEIINEMDHWNGLGMEVQFWLIPRKLNSLADGLAREAAGFPSQENWSKISGVLC